MKKEDKNLFTRHVESRFSCRDERMQYDTISQRLSCFCPFKNQCATHSQASALQPRPWFQFSGTSTLVVVCDLQDL